MTKDTKQAPDSARIIFATKMRELRQEMGLSQEELAERCGLHRTYIGSVERGERNISIDNMQVIAHALGTRLAYMVE